jgi:hypothetical protein
VSYLTLLKEAKERLGLCEISEEREITPFVCSNAKEDPHANEANEAKEAPGGLSYAHPWPDVLPVLGARHVGPYIGCADCGAGTWVRFGDRPFCLGCAVSALQEGRQGKEACHF